MGNLTNYIKDMDRAIGFTKTINAWETPEYCEKILRELNEKYHKNEFEKFVNNLEE